MAIELADDARAQAITSIRRYFRDELDQDIGDLKAAWVLEYFLRDRKPG